MICRFGISIRLFFIGVVALGILYIYEEGVLGFDFGSIFLLFFSQFYSKLRISKN